MSLPAGIHQKQQRRPRLVQLVLWRRSRTAIRKGETFMRQDSRDTPGRHRGSFLVVLLAIAAAAGCTVDGDAPASSNASSSGAAAHVLGGASSPLLHGGSVTASVRREPNGTFSRPVCDWPASSNAARCTARVRTDDHGHPLVGATPDGVGENGNGYDPADLQSAYAIPTMGGDDVTVGIVDAFDDPNAEIDLGTYRSRFGLSPCTTANGCFRKVGESGTASLAPTDTTGWAVETALDIEMVSAACPNCTILLVEANTQNLSDLVTANRTAVNLGATYISNSWGIPELEVLVPGQAPSCVATAAFDSTSFNVPGVTFFASSGDDGFGVLYPASSAFITAVGGTSLESAPGNPSRPFTETAWSDAGSGCSACIARPSWQTANTGCSNRAVADVSAVADLGTGVAEYESFEIGGWLVQGGTSVASPLVAAIYATSGDGNVHPDPSLSYKSPELFNDIVSGSNGTCSDAAWCNAGPGWDGPTGNGTPNGKALCSPKITSIQPAPGSFLGGTAVTITGTCFFDVEYLSVTQQGASAFPPPFVNESFTEITLAMPPDPHDTDGIAELTIQSAVGSGSTSYAYVSPTPLTLLPVTGPTEGGTQVTITGQGFDTWPGNTTVTFGNAPGTFVSCASSTTCVATAPAGVSGAVPVVVTVDGATMNVASGFTYQGPIITSISPSSGPLTGGTYVDIFGNDFEASMQVTFGGVVSPYVVCQSSQWCTVRSPGGALGPAEIAITLPGNVHGVANPPYDDFQYIPGPNLIAFTLNVGGSSPYPITAGAPAPGFVSLDGFAPVNALGGIEVGLSSSDPSVVTVPMTVLIPSGSARNPTAFPVTVVTDNVTEPVTLKATYQGVTLQVMLSVVPEVIVPLSMTLQASATSLTEAFGSVTLGQAATTNTTVLLSSNSSAASVGLSVVIPAHTLSAPFTVTADSVLTVEVARISAVCSATAQTCAGEGAIAAITIDPRVRACCPATCPSGRVCSTSTCTCVVPKVP
jgi:hypothetical protein